LTLGAPQIVAGANAVQLENQKPGTSAWQIGLPPYLNSNDTDQWIRGYASATSINKGEKITFNITVNPYSWKDPTLPVSYHIDVYRVGWYGGAGGRLMLHVGPFTGVQQPGGTSSGGVTSPGCPRDRDTGMTACQWTGDGAGNGSYTLDTSQNTVSGTPDWTSGIYLALLTTDQVQFTSGDEDHQSYIIFAIRDDARTSDILFQQAVATYQAYNNYPDDRTTGKSLYDSGSYGPLTTLGTERAVKVSFDRPYTYADHTGAGDFLRWELYFIRWLERNGYDVTYSTDVDTHANGARLLNHKAFISIGHAEYWSSEMRNAVEAARDHGTGLAFFGANAVYNQIRFEPSASGVPNRVVVCYKDSFLDPINNQSGTVYNPALTTVAFRSSPVNRPEQPLVGVMYDDYFDAEAPAQAYVVQNSGNWVYAGTGFTNGSSVPGILGYELDRQFSEYSFPSAVPGTYTLLSRSPFTGVDGSGISNSSIYQASDGPGAWVFAAGTIDWSWALDAYVPPAGINTRAVAAPNTGIQQTTANILNRFITPVPANPTNLTATGTTSNGGKLKINLAWTDNANNETGFLVERSLDKGTFAQIGSTAANVTSYSDTTAVSGTIYNYRVAAYNVGGNSGYSNTAVAGASSAPAAPSKLSAAAVSTSKINLAWQDNSTNENGFAIERSLDGANFSPPITVGANAPGYTDTGLSSNTRYYYRVRSFIGTVFSAYSNTSFATTPRK
jgi:hypothetical protein